MSANQEQSFWNTHLMRRRFQKMLSPYFTVAGFPIVLFSFLLNNALLFPFFSFPSIQASFPLSFFHCTIAATLRWSLVSGQKLKRLRKSHHYYDFNFPLYVCPSRGNKVLSLQSAFLYDVTLFRVHRGDSPSAKVT